ncbi:MAG: ATP-binding protein [Actinomycetota bacterium]
MSLVELEIPPRSIYVGVVRLAVSSLGRTAGLSEEAVDDLKIATSEACANAVLGAEERGSEDRVVVGWSEEEGRVVVTVDDPMGSGPAPSDAVDSQGINTRRVMSEALLQSLVDQVSVEDRPDGGTQTTLVVNKRSV